MTAGPDCRHQHAQNIGGNEIGLAEPRPIKNRAENRGDRQHQHRLACVLPGKTEWTFSHGAQRLPVAGLMVGNDVNIQIGQFNQAVCQTFFAGQQVGPVVQAPEGFVLRGVNYVLKGLCPACAAREQGE